MAWATPAPPFPSPESPALGVIVQDTLNALHAGSISVEEATRHAVQDAAGQVGWHTTNGTWIPS